MIGIELTQGQVAIIDDEDYELVKPHKWFAVLDHGNYYAKTNITKPDGKKTTLKMHRLIMGLSDSKMHVDHINHNGVDNRKENMRVCTIAENNRNKRKKEKNGI